MDTSPTALFDSYEQDFKQIIQSIRTKLEGDAQDAQGGASLRPCVYVCAGVLTSVQSSARRR